MSNIHKPWAVRPLGDLCDPSRGITYGIVKVGDFVPNGVPVVRGGDIRNNTIVFNHDKRVSEEVSNQFGRTILRGGELVMNLIAEPGHCALVPESMAGFNVSRDVAVIALDNGVNHAYVNHFLKSPAAISWLLSRLQGSVTLKINLGVLRDVPVPVPPTKYQDAVAEVLGALDDKIAVNERIAKTATELGDAQFEAAVATQPIVASIGEVAVFHNRHRIPLSSRQRSEFAGPYPYYGANGIVDQVADFKFHGDYVLVGEDGTVVADNGSPVTEYAHGRFWVNNHAHVLTGSRVSNEVLLSALKLADVRPYVTGAVQPKLSMGNLKRLPVVLPTESVLPALERQLRELYSVIESKTAESSSLAELRDALLPGLMAGAIRVRDAEKAVEDAT